MIFVENKLEQVALTKFRTTNITVCYLPQISIESLLYPQSPLRSYASPVTIFIQTLRNTLAVVDNQILQKKNEWFLWLTGTIEYDNAHQLEGDQHFHFVPG